MDLLVTLGTINPSGFCVEAKEVLGFIGWILTFFKVAIPIVIIAYGMLDLGKAVVASKDDEIKKQTKQLLIRAIAGIFIFFIPTLVLFLFGAIGSYTTAEAEASFDLCRTCVLEPWNCK